MPVQKWDMFAAELSDTRQASRQRHKYPPVECPYCGTVTRREDGICYSHRDLPAREACPDPYPVPWRT